MTKQELDRQLDLLAKKRDHCVDVLNNPRLGETYQREIDTLLARHQDLTGDASVTMGTT